MRRVLLILLCSSVLAACVTTRHAPAPAPAASGWDQRVAVLQELGAWQLDGRAAVAVGTQGWQASLNWRQRGESAEVHLSGPLGVGALVLRRTPDGLSLNGAPPSDAVLAQLRERLGFELPMQHLRFWLLGVPDPSAPFELKRNDQDRASQLIQDDWNIDYDRYMPADEDLLPAHLVLRRESVRVRIVVDHWEPQR
ncbi:MAG: outer rane lipoprotein LolB [Gammaproteobacteria bacterium]|nr:outer rane lipoprotein LolB [Gammaproteobacteria bacterium]